LRPEFRFNVFEDAHFNKPDQATAQASRPTGFAEGFAYYPTQPSTGDKSSC
jgi:hypothetical protein